MKRNYLLVLFFSLIAFNPIYAQSYGTALGLRFGDNDDFRMGGLSIQQRLFKKVTLEGIIQTDFQQNTTVHLLAERHRSILSKRLNLYMGAGISAGLEEYIPKNQTNPTNPTKNKTLGADLIAGLELSLLHVNISLDYKPNINMIGRESWYQGQVGISARSVIVKGSTLKKHKRERIREKRKKERKKERKERWDNFEEKPLFQDLFGNTSKKKTQ